MLCPHLQQTQTCVNLLQQPSIHIISRFLKRKNEPNQNQRPKVAKVRRVAMGMQKSGRSHSQWSSPGTTRGRVGPRLPSPGLSPAHRGHCWRRCSPWTCCSHSGIPPLLGQMHSDWLGCCKHLFMSLSLS